MDSGKEVAEGLFREALELAREHGCLSFELRAATSLARLMSRRDQRAEARKALEPVYGQFTEGFDTRDLQQAGELLKSLA